VTVGSLRDRRASGILLHPSSLPGPGIGTIGAGATRFVDWLADAGQSAWQILPLVAVDEGGSPYNGLSAFAANPLLIDPQGLVAEGLLQRRDLEQGAPRSSGRIDFAEVARWKERIHGIAFEAFREGAAPGLREGFTHFRRRNAGWLDSYSLFRVLRRQHGGAAWTEWEPAIRDRDPAALAALRAELDEPIAREAFQQFLFERQWQPLREHARRRGISIIGDVPIFVAHDSADVWANRSLFQLDAEGNPTVVSGVPPDYFSETGQRWGNPLYRWDRLEHDGYRWWVERFRRTLEWVDIVRIDHFRGFQAYWEVPADEETALNGRWVEGPGRAFFDALQRELGQLPVIAEDLGLITREVEQLRDDLELPGMRVLQFAFDGSADNPHLPENYVANSVAYTGTHDNDTISGWWRAASREERARVEPRIRAFHGAVHWRLMELVAHSGANLAIFPAQDLLGLDSGARMNTPGTAADNWSWRLDDAGDLDTATLAQLREMTRASVRIAHDRVAQHTP
jgi:4-alpha-glucanotransferase